MNFLLLTHTIQDTHERLYQNVAKAININLTLRNWLIGFYIVEYEQGGEDKAKYSEKLLKNLAQSLESLGLKSMNERELRRYRQFYQTYPHLSNALLHTSIRGTLPPEFKIPEMPNIHISKDLAKNEETLVPADKIIANLSFSHLAELIEISNPLKRLFFEVECIKGSWSVRELKRQINSLYFERTGMSENPEKMSLFTQQKTERLDFSQIIKSHYAFEFLEISKTEIIEESNLEQALLNHFQSFMLEMGRGFCLEARQKRVLIGDEYFFIDLVFYHRVLKCHIIVELKIDKFEHWHISQLNTYVNYYKEVIAEPTDNPPIGILLVANKNNPLVEFALGGIDNMLFVSKYLLELPPKAQLTHFIQNELKNL